MSSDPRWGDDARDNSWDNVQRDREIRDRGRDSEDPRDVFMRHADLPRGPDRETVRERNREYSLRGAETRALATVGAFRVVPTSELRDHNNTAAHDRSADIRHLREQGLIETVRVPGHRGSVAVLTKQGHDLLERHRDANREPAQRFYAGLKRTRELEHDSQIYGAYLQAAERMQERDVRVNRVVLDYELKSDYQKWLHEHDGDRDDYDGHHDRTDEEIRTWAAEHDLPYFDDQVHFPDFRIEYEEPDGSLHREDAEVLTVHYRGAHAAAAARSGFTCYGGATARTGGGRGPDPDLASELIR
jgi:DNA-binding MarR family transcriptional regulator